MDKLFETESPPGNTAVDLEPGRADQEQRAGILPRSLTFSRNFLSQKRTPTNLSSREKIRRNLLTRKGYVVRLDKGQIYQATLHHEKYTYNGTTLKGLAKFDDSRDYGISEEADKSMVRREIDRLVDAATSEEPLLFSGEGLQLENGQPLSFEDIHNVVDQILLNWQVIKHDNARLVLQHCPTEMENAGLDFRNSRLKLKARYMQKADDVEGCEPMRLEPAERNFKVYFALVDYITSSIARLLLRQASGKYWEVSIMSILAQWSAKLKNLSYDPTHYAALSLSNGEDAINQVIANVEFKQAFFLRLQAEQESANKKIDTFGEDASTESNYYQQKRYFRYFLEYIFANAARSILKTNVSTPSAGCFEACTLVYRTSLDDRPTMLSIERDGDIGGSSDPLLVNFSYSAMELLLKNVRVLATSTTHPAGDPHATIQWHWSDGKSDSRTAAKAIQVSGMDQIISFMVLLGLTSTNVANIIDDLVHFAYVNTSEEDTMTLFEPPPRNFEATFKMTTTEFLRKRAYQEGQYNDIDTHPVADGPMKQVDEGEPDEAGVAAKVDFYNPRMALPALDKQTKRKLENWVISEDSIIIECGRYVLMIISISVVVVLGGMCVPFLVKQKISGVDPFQFTTFAWVIACFISVFGKSLYVADWPWHDFVRGRVVCHSVADTHDVTGVHCQTIIWKILHAEHDTILWTKGPHNGMFSRKLNGSSGFAIDEPVHLSTMLASGFVVLKVLNEKGEHLICMDLRKGTVGETHSRMEREKFLASMNVEKNSTGYMEDGDLHNDPTRQRGARKIIAGTSSERVLKLVTKEFRWNKVLGLYEKDSSFG